MPRRLNEEFVAFIANDRPHTTNFSNTALIYLNRQTFDEIKREYALRDQFGSHTAGITQMFGITVMLYHGIPLDQWELVQRASGENITSGYVWEGENAVTVPLSDPLAVLQDLHATIKEQTWVDERGKAQVLTGIKAAMQVLKS
jgi:hypothetical protein